MAVGLPWLVFCLGKPAEGAVSRDAILLATRQMCPISLAGIVGSGSCMRQLAELAIVFQKEVGCCLDGGRNLVRMEREEEVKDGNTMVVAFGVVLCDQSRGERVK